MGLNHLYIVGIDRRAPVDVREKVSFGKKAVDALTEIKEMEGISEAAVLSTCHRSEVYFISAASYDGTVRKFFSEFFEVGENVLKPYLFTLRGCDAVEHLFRVACGLESMVLGEDQILGQVKEAGDLARDTGSSGKILNKLFRDAVTLGKRARAETHITDHPLSISYIAVKFIQEVFKDLGDKTAYVIGTGEMGRLVIKYLLEKGIKNVFVSNRTYSKVIDLKREMPAIQVIPWEQKYEKIAQSDIVISATDAPHYTVDYDKFKASFNGRKICMVDIALPRDIDPRIGEIEGIALYTIDDLKNAAEENRKKREKQIAVIENMVNEAVADFVKWHNALLIVPAIRHLNDYAANVCHAEYERVINKLTGIEERERQQIKYSLERVGAKIVNRYLMGLKALAEAGKLDPSVLKVFESANGNTIFD
jgi:glutamyl-tRNA reductase